MVAEISADELWDKIQRGESIQIIDIRSERQFKHGHIPGAVNIPFDRFAQEVDKHEWQDTIVFACPKGESSLQAARLLESYEGVTQESKVANLDGGYNAWSYDLEHEA